MKKIEGATISLQEFMEFVEQGVVPPLPPVCASNGGWNLSFNVDDYSFRHQCNERGMWAIVDKRWTEVLAEWIGHRKCLEVMAGAGYLAKALREHGVEIVATDNFSWNDKHSRMTPVFPVDPMDAAMSVRLFAQSEVLIVSWPPYGEEAVTEVCRAWGEGRPIVYIGEGEGGCNAPDSFWGGFKADENMPDIPLMCWPGIHDYVQIGYWHDTPPNLS